MILANSFTPDWIHSHRDRSGFEKINPPLVEKMIYALALVESLAAAGLDFVFKGGTSLVLLLPSAGRFSIDIDIITQAEREEIERILNKICTGKPFLSFRLNEQRSYKPGVPKAHYSLFYQSGLTGKDDHILLDILFDEHPYSSTLETAVKGDWIQTDETSILVKIPTHESITGDKLTAFAPNTTGIPYRKGKELEIVKQLFDLGRLFPEVKNMREVAASFDKTVSKEIVYRGGDYNRNDVLDDIIQTGLMIARREKNKGEPQASNFIEIQRGLLQFKAYQMSSFFRIEEAIISSAQAAYMAASVKVGAGARLEIYQPEYSKQNFLIQNPEYIFLNKLQAEPLFYWHKTIETLELP
ncbi:MAG: nucleotidyl transferase AbiEii/AbiGii toxin family protein [Chitinophagaceae bacterium]|nr:nucleotidyl transferase AbiEii/AbiGii toxin family protein [Chitinophagaceae bacterium]